MHSLLQGTYVCEGFVTKWQTVMCVYVSYVSIAITKLPNPLFNSLHGYIFEIAFKLESLHWWSTQYIWLNSDVVDVSIASSNNAVE